MANVKIENEKDRRVMRSVTLSENETNQIKEIVKEDSLTVAIRKMLSIIKKRKNY